MAAKSGFINARIDQSVKERAERIMKDLGIKPTQVINMLYHQIILRKGIPFDIEIPENDQANKLKKERTMRFAGNALSDMNSDKIELFLEHVRKKSNFFGDRS